MACSALVSLPRMLTVGVASWPGAVMSLGGACVRSRSEGQACLLCRFSYYR